MKNRSRYISPKLEKSLGEAISVIREGGVVAFPTETSYGLAADPYNKIALEKLYTLKHRDPAKPILVLVSDPEQLQACIRCFPSEYNDLTDVHWPGPLTLIFPVKKKVFPQELTAGLDTIAIRWSSHPVASALVERAGIPLTATSANLSGQKPALSADECRHLFGHKVDYIIDHESECKDSFSTIVGIEKGNLVVLRSGELDLDEEIGKFNKR